MENEDDVILSSDPEPQKKDSKFDELKQINEQYKSDSSHQETDQQINANESGLNLNILKGNLHESTGIQNALSAKRRINKKKFGDDSEEETEEEWRIVCEGDQSEDEDDDADEEESDVSLVSDYVPEGYYNGPKQPKVPERKSIFELFKEFKYKKIQKASKESYLKLNQGIEDGGDEIFNEEEDKINDLNIAEPNTEECQDSVISEPVNIWDLLPFSPPVYKCIRLPMHLKWITIHHSTKVNETVLMQEICSLEQEIQRLRFCKSMHQQIREFVGFPIGIMKSACSCCGQWTIKKHFCLHEMCSAESCKHKKVIMESRITEQRMIELGEDIRPRRGRPKRFLIREDGIFDKESQTYISHDGTQSIRLGDDFYYEDDIIFIITKCSKEERREYAEEFKKQENEKAEALQKIYDKVKEEEDKKNKEKEDKKKKREVKEESKIEEMIKEETNDKPEKKRTRRKKKSEENKDIKIEICNNETDNKIKKSPSKRVRKRPTKPNEKTLSELIKDILPSDLPQDTSILQIPQFDSTFDPSTLSNPANGTYDYLNQYPYFMYNSSVPLYQSCSTDQYTFPLQNPYEMQQTSIPSKRLAKITDNSYCNAFDDIADISFESCRDLLCIRCILIQY